MEFIRVDRFQKGANSNYPMKVYYFSLMQAFLYCL